MDWSKVEKEVQEEEKGEQPDGDQVGGGGGMPGGQQQSLGSQFTAGLKCVVKRGRRGAVSECAAWGVGVV